MTTCIFQKIRCSFCQQTCFSDLFQKIVRVQIGQKKAVNYKLTLSLGNDIYAFLLIFQCTDLFGIMKKQCFVEIKS